LIFGLPADKEASQSNDSSADDEVPPGRSLTFMTDDDVADKVIEAVAETGHPYELVPCDPSLADTAEFCAAYGYSLGQSANAIVVVGKPSSTTSPRVYAACLVLATTRLDVNGVVRQKFGTKKASFADADDTRTMTGMEIGGVTPYGLPAGLPLWIDSRIMAVPNVIVGGGSRDRKLLVPPQSLASLPGAEVVPDLAKELADDRTA
jgi:prolyl-tRNA editing enzyme YbaK/EbsC (Cys-tRNA(Pro) deacylase)